jgi:hypothetical protein
VLRPFITSGWPRADGVSTVVVDLILRSEVAGNATAPYLGTEERRCLVLIAVILALLLALLGFAMTNLETRVPVTLWQTTYQDVPVWSLVYLAVLSGVVAVGIIAVVDGAFIRLKNRQLVRELRRIETELNFLRTQPAAGRREPRLRPDPGAPGRRRDRGRVRRAGFGPGHHPEDVAKTSLHRQARGLGDRGELPGDRGSALIAKWSSRRPRDRADRGKRLRHSRACGRRRPSSCRPDPRAVRRSSLSRTRPRTRVERRGSCGRNPRRLDFRAQRGTG